MFNFNDIHLPVFLKNKELNSFYLSVAIMTFGESLINIFVPIYLYSLGYAVHKIIFFYFIVSLSFFIFSYPGAVLVYKTGAKHAILCSTPFTVAFYLGLAFLPKQSMLFFILPFFLSWSMILYNYGFHLTFIVNSKKEHRGKEVSLFEGIIRLSNTIAPFVGGIIAFHSFFLLYISGIVFLLFGTIPLFLSADKKEPVLFSFKELLCQLFSWKEKNIFLSFSGYAIESIIGRVIWPIFLIIILVSIQKTGFIVMLSTLLSLLVFYLAGALTDKWNKAKLLRLGTVLYFFGWFARVFATSSFRILLIDSYKNLAEKVLHIPWETCSYDIAVKKDYFLFIVRREITYNLSRVVFLPFLILLFLFTEHAFMASFIIASVFSVFYVFLSKS